MAPSPLLASLLILNAGLLILTAEAKSSRAPSVVAPGPAGGPLNLTAILSKNGQYTTLLRLLKETQVSEQIESQINNSYNGLTLFAPTDSAFAALKAGALNSLDNQDQVSLVLYHVLPRYYSPSMFATTSNPVNTQASGSDGVYTLNITGSSNRVNVSTGVDDAVISSSLYSDFPFAVYSVDKVLLPYQLFGPKPPASAPAPAPAVPPKKKHKKAPVDLSAAPVADADTKPSGASFAGREVQWGMVVGAALLWIGSVI